MKKVLVVSDGFGSQGYYRPFREFGEMTCRSELLWEDPEDIALVVFTGGADVCPSLYGQETAQGTGTVPRRDIYEQISFRQALLKGLPMAGVCRGAQFLCVMDGGKLVQHLDNHGRWHLMTTSDGRRFDVSSTHHQMMLPGKDAVVVGWATTKQSRAYYGESNRLIVPPPEREIEVVYFQKIRAVGMQYHPEIMTEGSEGFRFAAQVVRAHLFP